MSQPHEIHTRRLEDLISYVQNTVDEVNEYLSSGRNDPEQKKILMGKQASSISVLRRAIEMQQELLDQLSTGEPLPSRRATDPHRGTPKLTAVEEELDIIRRRAGIVS